MWKRRRIILSFYEIILPPRIRRNKKASKSQTQNLTLGSRYSDTFFTGRNILKQTKMRVHT